MTELIEKEALLEKVQKIQDEPSYQHEGEDWMNGVIKVEEMIYSAPAKEAVPVDFMREYIQRDDMSIHDISVIGQMYEAYKEQVKSDR